MTVLNEKIWFPDINTANNDGLLAIGGDLSVKRLILAYKNGIFPWYEEGQPLLWWSPDPRFVLFPEELKVSKSTRQVLRNKNFIVTVNKAFENVIRSCSEIKRNGETGTWITESMIKSYIKLYDLGYAKSVEVWQNDELIGGLYGVDLGNVFCGESMFSKVSNASKIALVTFIQNTNYKLIDCQMYTNYLASLGAKEISRDEFLKFIV